MDKVAFILAHPDDAEIWCGGLILNLISQKAELKIYYVYGDDEIRRQEAEKVVRIYGAEIIWIGNNRIQLVESLIQYNPSKIITHWKDDTNYEHRNTFEIVDKIMPQLVFSNKMNFKLFSCEPSNGMGKCINEVFLPNQFIDISDNFDKKIELISMYTSQNPSYWISMIQTQNALNGRRVGVMYAEGYIQLSILGVIRCSQKNLI